MSSTTGGIKPLSNLESGARLGKYIILNEIGRGGMAVVYKAHQPDLDRVVAVKVLFGTMLQQRFIERFQAEARALAKMNHPNVIRIFEVGEQEGAFFLVMEYIQGSDLLAHLHEKKPSFDETLEIMVQLGEALSYCHKQGILHRDLKPINILMRGLTPVVIDFGLAKAVDPDLNVSLTLSGEVVGSPAYMSPEQAQGEEVGVLADICALGIIMYELISFKNPYLDPRSLHQTALNAIQAEPVPLRYLSPWIDSDFAAIIAKAMAKDPAERYQDLEQLLHDLHAFRLGQPILAKPPGFFKLAWRFVKTNPVLYIGAAFFVTVGTLVGIFLSMQSKNKETPFGLVLEESFSKPDSLTPFTSLDFNGKAWVPSSSWRVSDGRLQGTCAGLCCAVADQEFFGDLKVEFTAQGLEGGNGDFNAFLFGATPEESFRFTLGEWGGGQADIEYGPRTRFPHGGAPARLNGGIAYKVSLEKEGHFLRLRVDDRLLVEKFYALPVKIERNSKIGFYTWNGGLAIDDIRIYKKAVALAAGPTVVADAYQEEGFIKHSIPAYRHVIDTYPGKAASFEAHLKLGKSHMVMGDFPQAIQHLTAAAGGSKEPSLIPEALFQLAQCQFQTGRESEGYQRLKLLHATYPESDFNRAVVQNRVDAVYACLNTATPDACLRRFNEEIRFLIENEDLFRAQVGRAHVELLELFRRLGVGAALQKGSALLDYYAGVEDVQADLRHILVRNAIGQGDLVEANRLLVSGRNYAGGDRAVLAEQVFLEGALELLQGRVDPAQAAFSQLRKDFSDVPGAAFRSIAHGRAAQSLTAQPGFFVDNRIFVNDAVSRRERLFLAYFAGRMDEAALQRILATAPPASPSLEEALLEYLKREGGNPSAKAAAFQSVRARFADKTFESSYLEFLLSPQVEKTVITP